MNRVLEKSDQFNTTMFHGKLVVNKPVIHDVNSEVEPFSNLYYWSHAMAFDDCVRLKCRTSLRCRNP